MVTFRITRRTEELGTFPSKSENILAWWIQPPQNVSSNDNNNNNLYLYSLLLKNKLQNENIKSKNKITGCLE